MRVRWLRTALRNLEAEASFIAEDDPAAGLYWVQISGSSRATTGEGKVADTDNMSGSPLEG
jgi:hypothetical protein